LLFFPARWDVCTTSTTVATSSAGRPVVRVAPIARVAIGRTAVFVDGARSLRHDSWFLEYESRLIMSPPPTHTHAAPRPRPRRSNARLDRFRRMQSIHFISFHFISIRFDSIIHIRSIDRVAHSPVDACVSIRHARSIDRSRARVVVRARMAGNSLFSTVITGCCYRT